MGQQEELLDRARLVIRELRDRLRAAEQARPESVAVVGMACRFPGSAEDCGAFWRMVEAGEHAVREVPRSRWNADALYNPDPSAPGTVVTRHAAFLSDVAGFDAAFFDIAPREAVHMDPQQRLFLEVAWHALENAGLTREQLAGSETGVFVGVHNHSNDYYGLQSADLTRIDTYTGPGTGHDVIAGRLSYLLDLHGPSVVINTACSSSLVAVHVACRSLAAGDCRTAIVGGVNLLLQPATTMVASRLNLLAPDGRCKPFDSRADGFGRGEGCGVVVLKRLSDALASRDRVLALIRGSAINQDGRTNGLTAPNGLAQQRLIRRALEQAGVDASQIGYVEAHGTGTALGDPIEVEALAEVLGQPGAGRSPCVLGSVKGNIGHLEGAAGIAGLIKAVLVLQHGVIPPVAQLQRLNPHIALEGTRLQVPTAATPWKAEGGKRFAGVSSFGWSGTNAHVVLEGVQQTPAPPSGAPKPTLVAVSAATPEALRQWALAYAEMLEQTADGDLESFAYTAGMRRTHHLHRFAVTGSSPHQLARKLREKAAQGKGAVEHEAPLEELAARYEAGEEIAWAELFSAEARCLELPHYPFQHRRYWIETDEVSEETEKAPDDWFYEIAWVEAPRSGADERVADIPLIGDDLEREATRYVLRALQELGCRFQEGETVSADALGVVPAHRRLFDRLLSILREEGFLRVTETGHCATGKQPAGAPRDTPEHTVEGAVLRKCGSRLAGVLQGAVNPLELLFGAGDGPGAEELYKDSAAMRACQQATRAAFESAARRLDAERPLRVLELGAGTGATTEVLLQDVTVQIGEYMFTDVSRTLLYRAAEQFRSVPFLRCAALDIERDPAAQGFGADYDIVVAANVLHATRNLRESLEDVRQLLAPGGTLVLLETTAQRRWVDLVFGLTEGWWRFSDRELRPEHALLNGSQWRHLLEQTGFAEADAVKVPLPEGASLEQSVVVAQNGRAKDYEGKTTWLVLADREGFAERLAKLAATYGERATVVYPGEPLVLNAGLRGVLCCWPLDLEWADKPVASKAEALTWNLVQLCQTLVRERGPKLWVVTRGAQDVTAGKERVAEAQSSLWGLAAGVVLEHPEHWGGLIDLDPSGGPVEADRVWQELSARDGESQVALRDDRRLVARLRRSAPPVQQTLTLREQGTYLVTGAFGGIGMEIARWLAEHGAKHLALIGRSGVLSDSARDTLRELQSSGVEVQIIACDVADAVAVSELWKSLRQTLPPVRGIVHAAAMIDVRPLTDLQQTDIAAVFRPKVRGALCVEEQSREQPLDFLVFFSSAAASMGARGRAHYAAANQFLDAFAGELRQRGQPACSIAWGAWEVLRSGTPEQRDVLFRSGFTPMAAGAALDAMGRLILAGRSRQIVARVDWDKLKPAMESRGRRLLLKEVDAVPSALPTPSLPGQLHEVPVETRREWLVERVSLLIRQVFGLAEEEPLDLHRGFFDMGMDSLMSVELKGRLEKELGQTLPGTLTLNYPTVTALAGYLSGCISGSDVPPGKAEPDQDAVAISGLTDEEAREALAAELQLLTGRNGTAGA